VLTITPAAAEMIRDFLRRSGIPRPVVCLGEVSKDLGAPRYLYPLIYPRSRFLWLKTDIAGLPFVPRVFHPRSARPALKNGVLDVAARGLVLKDPDGTVVLPKHVTGAL
jgi:hypothetical protein